MTFLSFAILSFLPHVLRSPIVHSRLVTCEAIKLIIIIIIKIFIDPAKTNHKLFLILLLASDVSSAITA